MLLQACPRLAAEKMLVRPYDPPSLRRWREPCALGRFNHAGNVCRGEGAGETRCSGSGYERPFWLETRPVFNPRLSFLVPICSHLGWKVEPELFFPPKILRTGQNPQMAGDSVGFKVSLLETTQISSWPTGSPRLSKASGLSYPKNTQIWSWPTSSQRLSGTVDMGISWTAKIPRNDLQIHKQPKA